MTSRSRALDLLAVPAALLLGTVGTAAGARKTIFTLVPTQSSLAYTFTQAGAANRGTFKSFSVIFDPSGGRLAVVIDMRSFDTGDAQRNLILGGDDILDVARFPEARFTATRIDQSPSGFTAVGTLTLRGITHTVAVPFSWRTARKQGRTIGYLTGQITLHRLEYGIGQGQWQSTEWVGNEVPVHYSLQFEAK